MLIKIKSPKQSLKGMYLNSFVEEKSFIVFKENLKKLITEIEISNQKGQTEKHQEKLLQDFLNEVYYKNRNYINSKSYKGLNECDFVIHHGKDIHSPVRVLFELKTPRNTNEMVTTKDIQKQSMFELVLYYLWEKFEFNNDFVSNLVITNFKEWFIFDSHEFEANFNTNKFKKYFKDWRDGNTDSSKTKQMYDFINKYIQTKVDSITFTHFDLNNYKPYLDSEDKSSINELLLLYKILSPKHLLSEKDEVDSNSLNKNFYSELLYIIGVEEKKEKGKIIIQRKEDLQPGSLIESTISILKSESLVDNVFNKKNYGENYDEQLFNIGLELCITWVNRIIFLKLLETQLLNYHNENNDYSFIGSDKIYSFQQINQLFFEVLSERVSKRHQGLNRKFKNNIKTENIPYLNSSLFEPTSTEKNTLRISGLDEEIELEVFSKSLVSERGKSLKGKNLPTIKYFLKFLESYDFGLLKGQKLIKTSSEKTIINSSVLGLIFEKINGYKDGSVFTPSFITEEMTKETIEKVILKKFNERYNWTCGTYVQLYNHLDINNILEYNELINELKICDPSVGSGHYLVSVLNELIKVKSKLEILCDKDGQRLKNIEINIENNELVIRYDDGNVFDYNLIKSGKIYKEKQRIQESIFHEKKTLIENSLFGVDINPNSVQICRLRLWIELLKSSFYTEESKYLELQTLPNIDINIKQGNSLLQKFGFDENLSSLFKGKFKVKDYQLMVTKYKETNDKKVKSEILRYLKKLKLEIKSSTPRKLQTDFDNMSYEYNNYKMSLDNIKNFGEKVSKEEENKLKDLLEVVNKKKYELDNMFNYEGSFEWRFEFPELLNDKGEFLGFDVVIGNPPYVVVKKEDYISKKYDWNSDLYLMFFQLSIEKLLKKGGFLSFITPRFYMVNKNCLDIRKSFTEKYNLYKLIETNPFEDVNTECVITYLEKNPPKLDYIPIFQETNKVFNKINDLEKYLIQKRDLYTYITFLTKEIDDVLDIIERDTLKLEEIYKESVRGLEIGKKDLRKKEGNECLIGEDINRYVIDYQETHVSSSHKESVRLDRFFNLDNIVYLRRVSKDLKSTVSKKKYSFNKNIYGICLGDNYSKYFICGLLNSELLNFYYKYKFSSKKEDLFPEVQKYLYKQLPIKTTEKEEQTEVINLVKKLLLNPTNDVLIKELNDVVYSLYGIKKSHVKIIHQLIKKNEN